MDDKIQYDRLDKTAVQILNMDQAPTDFAYWQTRSFAERLAALESIRNDLMTSLKGVEFDTCYTSREEIGIAGLKVNLIDLKNLIKNKKATGRYQDLADLENLK